MKRSKPIEPSDAAPAIARFRSKVAGGLLAGAMLAVLPFQTAAIQDSYIEKLIGLDGIKEFPVYLCGAGVPAKRL